MEAHGHSHSNQSPKKHHHHILSTKMAVGVWIYLLCMTVVTVAVAQIDLGRFNFIVAITVATLKAGAVAMIFMGLYWDNLENSVIFLTSILFVAIFMILTSFDIFFRGDVYTNGKPVFAEIAGGPSKFKDPWQSRPEIVAHGKTLFQAQCVSCHGDQGLGNGPAAAGLNPKPRNFTQDAGWKNGRKPSLVYKTLTKGLNAMPAFTSLPGEDRWALAHYVNSLGATAAADSADDLKAAGVGAAEGAGASEASIPAELAAELLIEEAKSSR